MIQQLALPIVLAFGGIQVVLPQGNAGDCDGNGITDATEIAVTPHVDTNHNGTLDACEGLSVDLDRISLSAGGEQELRLNLGPAMAGSIYWMVGSIAGDAPGMPFGFTKLPLNFDGVGAYMLQTLQHPNQGFLRNGLSILDASGQGTATFEIPAGFDPAFAGVTVHHAYLIVGPDLQSFLWASNAVSVTLEP